MRTPAPKPVKTTRLACQIEEEIARQSPDEACRKSVGFQEVESSIDFQESDDSRAEAGLSRADISELKFVYGILMAMAGKAARSTVKGTSTFASGIKSHLEKYFDGQYARTCAYCPYEQHIIEGEKN